MPNHTPFYNFNLPLVNSATDQDLWGGYLNDNFSSLDTDLKSLQDQITGIQTLPPGAMTDYGGTTAPAGFLECDGTAVSRVTYAALFTAIGTTWGAGDGTTTFNLPASARNVSVGRGGTGTAVLGNAVGNTGGTETNALTTPNIPAHSHIVAAFETLAGSTGGNATHYLANTDPLGNHTSTDPVSSSVGSGTAFNIIQNSMVVMRIIKT